MSCHERAPEREIRVRRMGIDTYLEPVIFMRRDCPVCRSEGFQARSRVAVRNGGNEVVATLNVVSDQLLDHGEAGLSESAWTLLGAGDGATVRLAHPSPVESLAHVRAKVFGARLDETALGAIVRDVTAGRYTDVEIATFLTACAGDGLIRSEVVALTRAMAAVGERLRWAAPHVVDKHCVGGLPGNRTTPIVVAIVAANGLVMPKTSSRAITSPAGTADTMETLAPVDLDLDAMRRVVDREGGCVVWGGAVRLSPADDVFIRVERAIDVDAEGQLVASVLSKKLAAGATHVVIDVPVGPTAKVRDAMAAHRLAFDLGAVGREVGLEVRVVTTDGAQPVGRGIGPALEARDVLAVLRGETGAPPDLRERAVRLAGEVLEMGGAAAPGEGAALAETTLRTGRAARKFEAIREAQGGAREPPVAMHRHEVLAERAGAVAEIDNRRLARIAKLSGAPTSAAAGIELRCRLGALVARGDVLFTVHAETPGELAYALDYARRNADVVRVGEAP